MRLERIDLIRFGHFSGETLRFRTPLPGEPLVHVLCAPNEAGKSTALHAIREFLFGIRERRTGSTFLHGKDLCIGGQFVTADGTTLEVRRHGGRRNPLRDPSGSFLDEGLIRTLLAGIDETLYADLFALDHLGLRQGGERLATGKGGDAAALFAAASGLDGLPELVRDLLERAEKLLGPRTKGQLRSTVKRYRDSVKDLQGAQEVVSPARFKELDDAVRRAGSNLERARAAHADHRAELRRLERIQHTAPLVVELADTEDALRDLGPVAPLAPETAARWITLRDETTVAHSDLHRLAADLERTRADLGRLAPAPDLLAAEAEIDGLVQRLGAAHRSAADLPKRREELRAAREKVADICTQLGSPGGADADPAALAALVPPRPARDGLRAILVAHHGAGLELQAACERLAEARVRLDEAAARAPAERPPDVDVNALEDAFTRISAAAPGRELRQLAEDGGALRTRLETRCASLTGFGGSLDQLARLDLPSPEEIDNLVGLGETSAREREQIRSQLERESERLRLVEREIASLDAGHIPSPERLAEARVTRDHSWSFLRRHHIEGLPLDSNRAADPQTELPATRLAEIFSHELIAADEIADDRHARAEEVERLRTSRRDHEEREAICTSLRERLARADEERLRRDADWAERWRESGIRPGPPIAMARWVREQREITTSLSDLVPLERKRAELLRRTNAWTADLALLLQATGATPPALPADPANAVEVLLAAARRELDRIHDQSTEARLAADERKRLERDASACTEAQADAQRRLDETRQRRTTALERIGSRPDVEAAEATSTLALLDELERALPVLAKAERRTRSIAADLAGFEEEARRDARQVDPGRADNRNDASFDAFATTLRLEKDLRAARETRAQREVRSQDEERQRVEFERASNRLTDLERERAALLATLGAADDAAAAHVLERAATLGRLESQHRSVKAEILRLAPGLDLEEARREARERHPDAVEAELAGLMAQTADLQATEQAAIARQAEAEAEVRTLETLAETEDQAAAVDRQRTALAREAAEWLELQTTALLLASALEAERERTQPRQLKRAGRFLERLTRGRWTGLVPSTNAAHGHELLARGAEGTQRRLAELSDGTRDQLFLALRLAAIEDHAQRGLVAPVIADDLLVHFDDERGAAALHCLADLSRSVQVIVFTHHRQVVEAARTELGPALDAVGFEQAVAAS